MLAGSNTPDRNTLQDLLLPDGLGILRIISAVNDRNLYNFPDSGTASPEPVNLRTMPLFKPRFRGVEKCDMDCYHGILLACGHQKDSHK